MGKNRIIQILIGVMLSLMLGACNLGQPTPTAIPTVDLPVVRFLAPPNNSQVYEGTDFSVDILGEDSQGVALIEFFVDGQKINEIRPQVGITSENLRVEMNWLAQGLGFHDLTAIAYRLDFTRSDEAHLQIEVISR